MYLARNTTQLKIWGRWLKNPQIHQYISTSTSGTAMFTVRRFSLFYCRMGWIKLESTKWQEHDLLMMEDVYRPHMLVQSFCSSKFIAVTGKFTDSPGICVSSKKYLPYTNLHDTLTIDHIPAWHHIHLLWKPVTQLLLRYLKGHNATPHTGFESKANRFACCICTDAFNAESNNFHGRGG